MKNLKDIFNIIDKENIILEDKVNLKYGIEGIYLKLPGLNPTIGVSSSIVHNSKKYISVLAEELGHHFTTMGNLTAECITYNEKLYKCKKEKKARMWAANFLISDAEFVQALYNCESNMQEMSDYFNVTEEIIKYKILSITLNELKYIDIKETFKCKEIPYYACII